MKNNDCDGVFLTIGIPVYNAEKYVGSLMDKLLKVDNRLVEIILIDDGSKDNSLSICEKYKRDTVRVYAQENKGPSETRNRIIELSRGDWITFIDSDDSINPKEYNEALSILDIASDWYINIENENFYEKSKKIDKNSYELLARLVESEAINSVWGKFYKRNIIKRNKIKFDSTISIGEDLLFNIEYSKVISDFKLIHKKFYLQRENLESLTHRININKYNELMYVNQACRKKYIGNKKMMNSFTYIMIKNCLSCLKDYKKNKDRFGVGYVREVRGTVISGGAFLNDIKTTLVYWGWRFLPIKIIIWLL